MKNTLLAFEFATNMFGKIKPEIKERLRAVVENPSQETWDDTFSIILNSRMTTLWQAVLEVQPTFQSRRESGKQWTQIPSRETIIEAIKIAVYEGGIKERPINKEVYEYFYKNQ